MEQKESLPTEKKDSLPFLVHLLQFAFIIPFGSILAPLVLWLAKKDQNPAVDKAGREVLAFQGSVYIYFLGFTILSMIPIIGWLFGLLLMPVMMIAGLYVIYLMIKGCIATNKGQHHTYPYKLKFIEDLVSKL